MITLEQHLSMQEIYWEDDKIMVLRNLFKCIQKDFMIFYITHLAYILQQMISNAFFKPNSGIHIQIATMFVPKYSADIDFLLV